MQPLTIYPPAAGGKVFDPATGQYTGTAPAAITGRGLITAYSDQLVSGGAARAEDRQVIVIRKSLSADLLFKPGVEVVQVGDQATERVKPVRWEKDPAEATIIGHTARTATRQRFVAADG